VGGTFFARLGDVCGRRVPVIGSFVFFGIFSIACGFAQNLGQLIGFRALQGLGGSGLYTMVCSTTHMLARSKPRLTLARQ
jgi:MFS family permease